MQVPPAHRNAVGYNPLAVLVIMYQKEVVILHSWVAATQVRRGVGAPGAHNLPCRAARTHNIKGILHQKIFYRLNLIFWIVMGCGIAHFGWKGLKTTET